MHFFIYGGMAVVLLTMTTPLPAEEPLTEERAIELGVSHTDIRDWLQSQRDAITAQSYQQGQWQNPEIEYVREDLDLPLGNSREESYWLRQRFNMSGQLGLERDAAQQQRRAEEMNIDRLKRSLIMDIRSIFYKALHTRKYADALQDSADRLAKVNTIVKQRASAGDSSRYDSLRLQREWVLLQGQAATAWAQADSMLVQLANLTGMPLSTLSLAGVLLPQVDSPLSQWEQKLAQHPQQRQLTLQIEAQRLKAKAAGRQAWPELTLGVGQHEVSEPGLMVDGNSVAIGLEIPLFKRGNHKRDQASATMRSLQAEQRLLHKRLLTDLRTQVGILQTQIQAVKEINQALGGNAYTLIQIAEQAYRSGEMQVMELLDAYRSTRESQLQFLELQLMARKTYINIQHLIGESL